MNFGGAFGMLVMLLWVALWAFLLYMIFRLVVALEDMAGAQREMAKAIHRLADRDGGGGSRVGI